MTFALFFLLRFLLLYIYVYVCMYTCKLLLPIRFLYELDFLAIVNFSSSQCNILYIEAFW